MYLMWKDKNTLKIKVVSHKRAVSAKKKQPNNLLNEVFCRTNQNPKDMVCIQQKHQLLKFRSSQC